MKELHSPHIGGPGEGLQPIATGGTNANNIAKAKINLNLVDADDLKTITPTLGDDLLYPASALPTISSKGATIKGDKTVVTSGVVTAVITNYDARTTYTIAPVVGSVSRSGDTITYVAPAAACNGGFVINGRVFSIQVLSPIPLTPSVLVPTAGTTAANIAMNFIASAFQMDHGSDTHHSSDWMLATDANFNTVIISSIDSTVNLTTWNVNLSYNTTYYLKVRYKATDSGYSEWSNVRTFTTKDKPSIVSITTTVGNSGPHQDYSCLDLYGTIAANAVSDNKNIASWSETLTGGVGSIIEQSSTIGDTNCHASFLYSGCSYWSTYRANIIANAIDGASGSEYKEFKTKLDPNIPVTFFAPIVSVSKNANGQYYVSGTTPVPSYGCTHVTTYNISSNVASGTTPSSNPDGFEFVLGDVTSGTEITGTVTAYYGCHGKSSPPATFSFVVP